MKPIPEPSPMLDELEASSELHRGLSRLKANMPSAASMAAIAAGIGVSALPEPPVAVPKSGLPVLKLVGGIGLAIGAAIGGAQLWPDAPEQRPNTGSAAAAAVSAAMPASDLAAPPAGGEVGARAAPGAGRSVGEDQAPSAEEPVAPEPAVGPINEGHSPRVAPSDRKPSTAVIEQPAAPRKAGTPSAPTPPTSHENLQGTTVRQSETELLRDARSALGGSPAVALALTEKHRQEFARGSFAQEREVIAITALTRLGRSGDAQQRADRFRRDYPNSAYRRQIDQLVP
jgi:hypothetical protein